MCATTNQTTNWQKQMTGWQKTETKTINSGR